MFDVSKLIEAKSDQLNADDLISGSRIISVTKVTKGNAENPVVINYEGDTGRPFKPCKTVLRILSAGWGLDADKWCGKQLELYNDPTVVYAGKEVGGIRIKAMSGISKRLILSLSKTRGKKVQHTIDILKPVEKPAYPPEQFKKAFDTMGKMIADGTFTAEQVINKCEQTGTLTDEMKQQVRAIELDGADINIDEE